jgi:hypothetical protein
MVRIILCLLGILSATWPANGQDVGSVSPPTRTLSAIRQENLIAVDGNHFRLMIDAAKGGEITSIELFDGAAWNRVLGADKQTCPMLSFAAGDDEYRLCNDTRAHVVRFGTHPKLAVFEILASPCNAAGRTSPWTVRLRYEIYPEGAIFIRLGCELPEGGSDRWRAGASLVLDRAISGGAKYRQEALPVLDTPTAFETARVAFGADRRLSYTNELQAMLEQKRAICGEPGFHSENGRFTWILADGKIAVRGPIRYRNRFCLALGSGATGWRHANLIGQRIYHWANLLGETPGNAWYPTDEQIDRMAAHHGTVLILHQRWMREGGSNGNPHADYRSPRDEEALRRTIARAHSRGMRVGLYSRGIERYCLDAKFFEKYCERDWDGLYVDWHGPQCVAYHEAHCGPDASLADQHFSTDVSVLAAREYFLYLRRLRAIAGPRGFLIGHQGFGTAGVLPNLLFDAFLPGEAPFDQAMFANLDEAVYRGMLGAGVCHPWTLNSPQFTTPESIAKMAAWGFYPHVVLGMERPADKLIFPLDPNAKVNEFALPYWRLLAAIDMREAQVFNLPNQRPIAATCSDENIRVLIYKERSGKCLVITANLSTRPAKATVNLDRQVLGMAGSYAIERVGAQTGATMEQAISATTFETSMLSPWQFEGFLLARSTSAAADTQ